MLTNKIFNASALLSVLPSVKLVRLTHNNSVAEAHAANFATDFEFIRLYLKNNS